MGQIGDLFARWAGGSNPLTRGEIDQLRLELNHLQSGVSQLGTILAPTGGLDPNVFGNSGGFSVLPAEAARVSAYTAGAPLSVPNATWTALPVWSISGASLYNFGIVVSATDPPILLRGNPTNAIFLATGQAEFAGNTTGVRGIRFVNQNNAALGTNTAPMATNANSTVSSCWTTRLTAYDNTLTVQVYQNSGAALDLYQAWLAVTRLR